MASKDRKKYRQSDMKGYWNKAFEKVDVAGISGESTEEGYDEDSCYDGFIVIDSDGRDFYDVTMADIRTRREAIDLRDNTGGKRNNNNNVSSATKSRNKQVRDNRSDENKIKSSQTLKPHLNQSVGKSPIHSPTSNTQQKNILRNAVYYQNRFILLDSPSDSKTNTNSSTNMSQSHDACDSGGKSVRMGRRQQQKSNDGNEETSFSNNKMAERVGGNRKNMEMDASSVTMDARGIEIILTDPENSSRPIAADDSKRKNTLLKKINRVLLDNRVKGRNSEIVLHRDNPEEYKVLKKVLNFIFLAIGAMLFLSVIICVIYAFAIGEPDDTSGITRTTTASP